MDYNSREVIEAKRRLHDHAVELKRSGGPHQQTLVDDINTLLQAHTDACEQINTMTPLLGAVTAGDDLAAIKKMASAGEPLIDIHAKRDGKGNVIG